MKTAAALTLLLVTAIQLNAGSIWEKGQTRTQMLFSDDTAKGVGDNITIFVEEKSIIENETKRDMSKSSKREVDISAQTTTHGDTHPPSGLKLDGSAKNEFSGDAKYDSNRKVSDEITVTVQDVLPNGNLVVLGTRTREVAGDKQIVEISGVVRPSDVRFDNTVASSRVAEFHVVYRHKGQENNFTNPGWFSRILNRVNPF